MFGIISVKPFRSKLRVGVSVIGERLLNCTVITFWARRASGVVFLLNKGQGFQSLDSAFSLFCISTKQVMQKMFRGLFWMIRNLRFGWVVEVNVRGNAYLWRYWRVRKLRRYALFVRAGFFFNLLVLLPTTLRMFWHKNYVRLFSVSFGDLALVTEYLRFVRDLFPYKLAGFIFEEERFKLKLGKRAKTKK